MIGALGRVETKLVSTLESEGITDLLTQEVPLEDVQCLAGHSDPRTTRLYDRRQK